MPGLLVGLLFIVVGGIAVAEDEIVGSALVLAGLAVLVGSLYRLHAVRPHPESPGEEGQPQEPDATGQAS